MAGDPMGKEAFGSLLPKAREPPPPPTIICSVMLLPGFQGSKSEPWVISGDLEYWFPTCHSLCDPGQGHCCVWAEMSSGEIE
jgi:hypothetical protein